MKYYVVFTIGPVQSFIASARKKEDLWSGSYLLSHLIERVLEHWKNKGMEVIFPILPDNRLEHIEIASLPNRITVVSAHNPQQLLKETEALVRDVFEEFCLWGVKHVFGDKGNDALQALTRKQVRELLEIYWVSLPFEEEEFAQVRLEAEQILGGIKNQKDITYTYQIGTTCSVCHQREPLTKDSMTEDDSIGSIRHKLNETWKQRKHAFQTSKQGVGRIKEREYLCGICLGKRVARDYFQAYYQVSNTYYKKFSSTREIAQGKGYYAVILMDGDNMGKFFTTKRGMNPAQQREHFTEISRRLGEYATKTVKTIVQRHNGTLIYAGGDDVLAFGSVHNILEMAKELREGYGLEQGGLGKTATSSASILIVHETNPLHLVLEKARKLEKKAKAYVNRHTGEAKNAFSIGVYTRSGEGSEFVLPWTYKKQEDIISTCDKLMELINDLGTKLSTTFLYSLIQEYKSLVGKDMNVNVSDRSYISIETKRLVRRSLLKGEKSERVVRETTEALMDLHALVPSTYEFMYLLKSLSFMYRKEDQ